jgi:hypothetical protein
MSNQIIIANKVPESEPGEANGFKVEGGDGANQYLIAISQHHGVWQIRITTTVKPERALRITIKRFFKPTVSEDFPPEKFHDSGDTWSCCRRGFPEEIVNDMSFPPIEAVHLTLEAVATEG